MRINFKRANLMGVMITLAMMILVGFTPLKASAVDYGEWSDVQYCGMGSSGVNVLDYDKYYKLKDDKTGKTVIAPAKKIKYTIKNKSFITLDKKNNLVLHGYGYSKVIAKYKGVKQTFELRVRCKKHSFIERKGKCKFSKLKYTAKVCKVCNHEKSRKINATQTQVKSAIQKLRKKYYNKEGYTFLSLNPYDDYMDDLVEDLFGIYCTGYMEKHKAKKDISKLKIGDVINVYIEDYVNCYMMVTDIKKDGDYTLISYTSMDRAGTDDIKAKAGWTCSQYPDTDLTLIYKDGKVAFYDQVGPNEWKKRMYTERLERLLKDTGHGIRWR